MKCYSATSTTTSYVALHILVASNFFPDVTLSRERTSTDLNGTMAPSISGITLSAQGSISISRTPAPVGCRATKLSCSHAFECIFTERLTILGHPWTLALSSG
jgi:hypothetical protein